MEKMTKRERFEALLKMESVQADAGMVEFINHEIELLNRKNSGASKKASKITAEIKEAVFEALNQYDAPVAIKDLIADCFPDAGYTSQKLVPVLKALEADGRVVRIVEKRQAKFFTSGFDFEVVEAN